MHATVRGGRYDPERDCFTCHGIGYLMRCDDRSLLKCGECRRDATAEEGEDCGQPFATRNAHAQRCLPCLIAHVRRLSQRGRTRVPPVREGGT